MEGDLNGTPGAVEQAATTTEVVRGAAAGDILVVTRPVEAPDASGAPQAVPSQEQPTGAAEAPVSAEAGPDDEAVERADLEQYPESVRDYLKGLSQEQRKTLHEHFGQREREQMQAERERADRIEADQKAAEARAAAIRESQGKFVGETAIVLTDPTTGETVQGPTYNELVTLLQTRRGRDQLWSTYQLSEDTAEAVKAEMDQRREMLTSSARHFEDRAWGTVAGQMAERLAAINGVDAEALLSAAAQAVSEGKNGPDVILSGVVTALEAQHAREMAAAKKDADARIEALTLNQEGMRGRVAAAEERRLPTGGRSGAQALSAAAEIQRLARENPDEYIERAKRGDFAGVNLTS